MICACGILCLVDSSLTLQKNNWTPCRSELPRAERGKGIFDDVRNLRKTDRKELAMHRVIHPVYVPGSAPRLFLLLPLPAAGLHSHSRSRIQCTRSTSRFSSAGPARSPSKLDGQQDAALTQLRRAIQGNYCSYPAVEKNPLFDSIRRRTEFRGIAVGCDPVPTKFLNSPETSRRYFSGGSLRLAQPVLLRQSSTGVVVTNSWLLGALSV